MTALRSAAEPELYAKVLTGSMAMPGEDVILETYVWEVYEAADASFMGNCPDEVPLRRTGKRILHLRLARAAAYCCACPLSPHSAGHCASG